MATIGFVGLGQMGAAMASNLSNDGHDLRVNDIDAAATERLARLGALVVPTPGHAAAGADFVITMLPNGSVVRETVLGRHGIADAMGSDALLIDMSTVHPADSDALRAELESRNLAMMDAPVGRTSDHAVRGELLILAGGTDEQIDRAQPLFDCLGSQTVRAGGPGMGIRLKIVNNFMSIALNALSAEAATLAEAIGLDLPTVFEVMSGTPAGKGHFTTTWPDKVLAGDLSPAFTVDLAHKDLGIALDLANQEHVALFCGASARELYTLARAAGRGGQDWTSVFEQLRVSSGLVPVRPPNAADRG